VAAALGLTRVLSSLLWDRRQYPALLVVRVALAIIAFALTA